MLAAYEKSERALESAACKCYNHSRFLSSDGVHP